MSAYLAQVVPGGHFIHQPDFFFLLPIEIYLLPSLNPDGFAKSPEGSCFRSNGRRNANNKDLNRDFPRRFKFPAGGQNVTKMFEGRQKETQAMMKWILEEPFVMVSMKR